MSIESMRRINHSFHFAFKLLLSSLVFFFIFTVQVKIVLASPEEDFLYKMENWTNKKELASKYLRDAEKEFKNGDELSGCSTQQKASKYGIEATESLIKAMKINGSTDGLENIEAGLNKWRELRDFC